MTFRSHCYLRLRSKQPITDVISAILPGKSFHVMSEATAPVCQSVCVRDAALRVSECV